MVVDSKLAKEVPGGPKEVNVNVKTLDTSAEVTTVIKTNPNCQLRQVGGQYYCVPSPPCPL